MVRVVESFKGDEGKLTCRNEQRELWSTEEGEEEVGERSDWRYEDAVAGGEWGRREETVVRRGRLVWAWLAGSGG